MIHIKIERVWASKRQKTLSSESHAQNILHKLQLLCEILHYGKSLISIVKKVCASVYKILISGGVLRTKQ